MTDEELAAIRQDLLAGGIINRDAGSRLLMEIARARKVLRNFVRRCQAMQPGDFAALRFTVERTVEEARAALEEPSDV
jgi:hypothetical protein